MQAVPADAGQLQQFLGQLDFLFSLNITFQVMTIAEMSAGYQSAVTSIFQCLNDKNRIDPARTHDPDGPHIGRMLKPGNSGQIRARIRTPVTQECNDFGFKIFHVLPC
jgi:hypothetical protein